MIRSIARDRRTYALLLAFPMTVIVFARLHHHMLLGTLASAIELGCILWTVIHSRRHDQPNWRLLVPLDRTTYVVCLLIALSVLLDAGLFVHG